eukprot:351002-Chlamydomonas_euryale.AAC.24
MAHVHVLPGRHSAGSRSLNAFPALLAAARRLCRWGFCDGSSAVMRPKHRLCAGRKSTSNTRSPHMELSLIARRSHTKRPGDRRGQARRVSCGPGRVHEEEGCPEAAAAVRVNVASGARHGATSRCCCKCNMPGLAALMLSEQQHPATKSARHSASEAKDARLLLFGGIRSARADRKRGPKMVSRRLVNTLGKVTQRC